MSVEEVTIIEDDLQGESIRELLRQHLIFTNQGSPPESVHSLGIEQLKASNITVYSAWQNNTLLGCIALKDLGECHGEIKSTHTTQAARRCGIASQMLKHVLQQAEDHGMMRLSLETGSNEHFAAARALYEKFHFAPCPPFGEYFEDPFSVYMTLKL